MHCESARGAVQVPFSRCEVTQVQKSQVFQFDQLSIYRQIHYNTQSAWILGGLVFRKSIDMPSERTTW